MAASVIRKFEAATLWLDGTSLVGTVKEIELPEIEWDSVDHETIALFGTPQYAGKLQGMETTITWTGYSPELAAAAANPYQGIKLQLRGNFGEYKADGKSADKALKIDLGGRVLMNGVGTYSPGEFERETKLAVDYIKETWDGTALYEISINPPIYRVNGKDILAGMRKNLGLGV